MKKALIWLGGALLTLALILLGRDGRALKRVEQRRDEDLEGRKTVALGGAARMARKAEEHKRAARLAAEKTKTILETHDEKDPSMGDLLSAWESRRVRKRTD